METDKELLHKELPQVVDLICKLKSNPMDLAQLSVLTIAMCCYDLRPSQHPDLCKELNQDLIAALIAISQKLKKYKAELN